MISAANLSGYALASFILIVIPGPSVLFVVGRALAYGRRTALATVCGNSAGNYVVAVCVAVGIGTLVQRSAELFTAVKLAGALYLIWLGIQAFRRRGTLAAAFGEAAPARSDQRAVREGFMVGVTNPKALILFGAVLPQFVDRAAGHVPVQMLLLSRRVDRDRAGLRQHVGGGGQQAPLLVRPFSPAVRPGRRGRRPGHDRRGRHRGGYRPPELISWPCPPPSWVGYHAASSPAGVAQMAEQPPCKRQVSGSIPLTGSTVPGVHGPSHLRFRAGRERLPWLPAQAPVPRSPQKSHNPCLPDVGGPARPPAESEPPRAVPPS